MASRSSSLTSYASIQLRYFTIAFCVELPRAVPSGSGSMIVDGGHLSHSVKWPVDATYDDIARCYNMSAIKKADGWKHLKA